MYPQQPIAGPDRTGRPHLTRTAVLLALLGAVLIALIVVVSYFIGPVTYQAPVEYTVPPGGYDPGLYTPFTQAPVQR